MRYSDIQTSTTKAVNLTFLIMTVIILHYHRKFSHIFLDWRKCLQWLCRSKWSVWGPHTMKRKKIISVHQRDACLGLVVRWNSLPKTDGYRQMRSTLFVSRTVRYVLELNNYELRRVNERRASNQWRRCVQIVTEQ